MALAKMSHGSKPRHQRCALDRNENRGADLEILIIINKIDFFAAATFNQILHCKISKKGVQLNLTPLKK